MSNILIIKHGSLGDISQISGALRDIREANVNKKIFILTTLPYVELLSKCPYVDAVLIDKRLPRWNLFYIFKLKSLLNKYNFSNVYDLQNSSRTNFYRKFLLKKAIWSCSVTTLNQNEKKQDFDKESVLKRFDIQLSKSNIKTKYTLEPDLSWASINVDKIVNKFFGKKFILLFPFCSPQLSHKKWPHFNKLISIIKSNHSNIEIVTAPGPNEIDDAKNINALIVTNLGKSLSIIELAGLINKASYIIANDTGPAHMAAHLGKMGTVIFGHHTTPKKVSIETEKFRAITSSDLDKLEAEKVYLLIKENLELIN